MGKLVDTLISYITHFCFTSESRPDATVSIAIFPKVRSTERLALKPVQATHRREVRAVIWQYWFTTMSERRAQGLWRRRQLVGLYAPTMEREPGGTIRAVEWPTADRSE